MSPGAKQGLFHRLPGPGMQVYHSEAPECLPALSLQVPQFSKLERSAEKAGFIIAKLSSFEDFSGGPWLKPASCKGHELSPGWGTKIPPVGS